MFKLLPLAHASAYETAENRDGAPGPKCNVALSALLIGLSAALSTALFGAKSLLAISPGPLKHFPAMFARLQLHAARVDSATHTFFPHLLFLGGKIGAHWGAILRLLCARGPLAVARRITTVVVSALQREPVRARRHIIVKVIEGLEPPFANGNAARSVPPIHRVIRIGASAAHLPPNAVEGMTREPAAFFVFHGALYHVS